MNFSVSEPGKVVSAALHTLLLVATVASFSKTQPLTEAQESVPLATVSEAEFNQVMRGDKEAKPQEKPQVRADKQAEVEEKKPPTEQQAKTDIPTPPPPLKRIPDPGQDDKPPEKPAQPQRVAAVPPEPPKPEPPKPTPRPVEPPKAEPTPEPPKRDAEAIEPPKRPPEPPKKVEPTPPTPPTPPTRPRPAPNQEAKPKEAKPLDSREIAKILEKSDDPPKPVSRPRSGDETSTTKPRFDANAASQAISRENPSQRPSTAREAASTASLGSATANAPKMSPSMWGQLQSLLADRYKQCWLSPPGFESRYVPQIKLSFNADGTLQGQPVLMNPASDPKDRAMAESALRAVRNPLCNPMRFPANFMPYFDQWKGPHILRFDPAEMMG